jgi:hypothetical protein
VATLRFLSAGRKGELLEVIKQSQPADKSIVGAPALDPQRRQPLKAIALETYAGRRYYPCKIFCETNKYYQVKILSEEGVQLPGRRYARSGAIVSVPKYAVQDVSEAHLTAERLAARKMRGIPDPVKHQSQTSPRPEIER